MKSMRFALVLLALSLAALLVGVFTSASAADVRPVIAAGALIGAFENGQWREGPGEITVDGKIVDLSDAESDPEFLAKLKKANDSGDGLSCETPLLKKGQKLVYFSPAGKEGKAVVTGTRLWYEGDATGAASMSIAIDGYEPDWSNLIVAVTEVIDAVPAPTIREEKDGALVFSCEYKRERYAVEWRRQGSDGEFEGRLSVGKVRSWPIEEDEYRPVLKPYSEEKDIFCGFFDLDGDGVLEFVMYDSGSNGCVAFFKIDGNAGPEMFVWKYTGVE